MKKIDDIICYKIASGLSDYIWEIVSFWDSFSKNTIGSQLVRAIDSVGANIAEGFGRYHKKDKVKFYYNGRASVFEAQFFIKKAYIRKLLNNEQYEYIFSHLRLLPKEINYLIKITCDNLEN